MHAAKMIHYPMSVTLCLLNGLSLVIK